MLKSRPASGLLVAASSLEALSLLGEGASLGGTFASRFSAYLTPSVPGSPSVAFLELEEIDESLLPFSKSVSLSFAEEPSLPVTVT